MIKILKILLVIIICNVVIQHRVFAEETYYLTSSEETLAWNKWHADVRNCFLEHKYDYKNPVQKNYKYVAKEGYTIRKNYVITFTVHKNKKISDLSVIVYPECDEKMKYKVAELYGDICKKYNLAPDEFFVIHYNDQFDINTSPKKIASLPVDSRALEVYNNIKNLENKDILTFPEGTRREKVTVEMYLGTLKSLKDMRYYNESEFNDSEVIYY